MHIKIFLFGGHKNFWTKLHWPNHINKKTAEILASNEWRRMRSTSLTNTDPSFPTSWGSLSMHTQVCPTLLHPINCRPPGSFVHGISQARRLEQVAVSSTRGSSQLRDQTQVSCIDRNFFFTTSTTWEVGEVIYKLPGLTRPLGKKILVRDVSRWEKTFDNES